MIPGGVQKNIIGSDCEHDPQPQTNANFKDAGMKPSHARASMLMRVADDAGQSSDGGVDARLKFLPAIVVPEHADRLRFFGFSFATTSRSNSS